MLVFISKINFLKESLETDIIIVNIENAAGGRGVTPKIADQFLNAGIDVLTTGNHVWDQKEIIKYISSCNTLLRPLNMPEGTPGFGQTEISLDDKRKILVINLMTNLFMQENEFVFKSLEKILLNVELGKDYNAIFVDLHGEATSEKTALANYFDGRILPYGTAYQTDVGMCGNYDSVIGMDKKSAIDRFFSKKSYLTVAEGEITICGVLIEVNDDTGKSINIKPIRIGGVLQPTNIF